MLPCLGMIVASSLYTCMYTCTGTCVICEHCMDSETRSLGLSVAGLFAFYNTFCLLWSHEVQLLEGSRHCPELHVMCDLVFDATSWNCFALCIGQLLICFPVKSWFYDRRLSL